MALQKQHKLKQAQGDPEAKRKILEEDEKEGRCWKSTLLLLLPLSPPVTSLLPCPRVLETLGKVGVNHIVLYGVLALYAVLGESCP